MDLALNNLQWLICHKKKLNQTNDVCLLELLEIEQFDHLNVCKQMFN